MASGSNAFMRIHYEVQALISAQESLGSLDTATKTVDAATDPTLALSALITGTDQARDALYCAAYLMGQYHAIDKNDKNIKALLVVSFNQEARSLSDMKNQSKADFLRTPGEKTSAMKVRDAEKFSSITAQQNEAASNILTATTLSLLCALDNNDPNAKTVEYLSLSCKERSDLLDQNSPLAQGDKSAYSQAATLVQKVLNEHKCRL